MGYYEECAAKAVKTNINIDHYPEIRGYNHEQEFDLAKYLDAQSHTGIQASNLGRAVDIIKKMREEKATIFLSYTSNMVSCGVRETIKYLVILALLKLLNQPLVAQNLSMPPRQ